MKQLPYLLFVVLLTLLVTACSGAATPANPDVATPDTGQTGGTSVDPTIASEVATEVSTASPEPAGESTVVAVETPVNGTPAAEGTPAPNETVVATEPSTGTVPTAEVPIENTVPITEGMAIPEGALMVVTRNGGIAGFCDTVTIYNDDRVTWESCNANQGGDATLDATLHDELLQFVEMYGNIAFEYTDAPGAADAMTIGVHIAGTGSTSLDENGQRNLLIFANDVFNSLYSITNS